MPRFSAYGRLLALRAYGPTWEQFLETQGPTEEVAAEYGSEIVASDRFLAVASNAGIRNGIVSSPSRNSAFDSVFIYAIDGDLNQNGIFDGCKDCDGNGLPDDFERAAVSIDAFVSSLLSENPSCAYDLNADGETNGRDLPNLIALLLSSP